MRGTRMSQYCWETQINKRKCRLCIVVSIGSPYVTERIAYPTSLSYAEYLVRGFKFDSRSFATIFAIRPTPTQKR